MDCKTWTIARRLNWVALAVWMLGLAFLLCGCSTAPQSTRTPIERLDFNTPLASSATSVEQGLSPSDYAPETAKNEAKLGLSEDAAKSLGCNIKDRFDRGAALAYNFDDRQSRLALHLSMEGPSFSDPTRLQLNSMMVRYTHQFSKPPQSKKEKCRVESNFQGVVGSAYNEFFVRNNYTVWQEIRHRLNISK
jgi:hypothetical protein